MTRLTEWMIEHSMRRSAHAAERFDGFGHLAPPGPAFVPRRRPAVPVVPVGRDADRIDAGRPPGCGVHLAGLVAIALAMAVFTAGIVYALAVLAG